ncbi:putative ATP-grasp-modified RiPP [Streptomyces sp. NPDC098789]|uniref:putative ATP-grasp-modified RiPP n=1 Tax=Streptomyces sp. NPDC098789 TaxID=3366098 RepID=UPI00382354A8
MATLAPQAPWAMRLVTDRRPIGPPSYAAVTLDASTQRARYTDTAGQVVKMGEHGTNQTNPTTSMSGGGDGAEPQPQTADDSTPDYSSD